MAAQPADDSVGSDPGGRNLTTALLTVALVTEVAACLGHRLSLRAVPAIAADFAIWLLIDVMTSSEGVPEGYHVTGPTTLTLLCFALLAIYGGSIGIRSFGLLHRVTIFEIGQGVLAFVLASFGVMRASHGSAAPALCTCCWRPCVTGEHCRDSQTRLARAIVEFAPLGQ